MLVNITIGFICAVLDIICTIAMFILGAILLLFIFIESKWNEPVFGEVKGKDKP